jgi:hypothetical protein
MQALLAQGIESVYSEDDEHLSLPQALERAFAARSDEPEPRTLRDALKRLDADLWYQAAVKEMEAHIENGTWELVKLPPGRKAIGSRWVFKVNVTDTLSGPPPVPSRLPVDLRPHLRLFAGP